MASKHDAKRARENHWVMQQNMAKQKSFGFVHRQPRPKAAPIAKRPSDVAGPPPAVEPPVES